LERVADPLPALRRRFTACIASGDSEHGSQVIDNLLKAQRSLLEIYLEIIAPALVSVGDSWCAGELGVGDEHLATQIVMQQMDRLRSLFVAPEPRSPYRVLVACVEGEQHFVGARMLADLCLLKGWGAEFLGAHTPTSAVVEMAARRHAHVLALSATMDQGMKHVRRLVEDLASLTPRPHMVFGGQLFASNPLPARLQGACTVAREADEGIEVIGKLLRADRPKAMLREYLLTLGRRVRELRTNKGWTQEELADATRVTRVCIVAVEGGKQNVSMDILIRLSNALGVSPEDLLSSGGHTPGLSRRHG
jgi:methanogenic corrinoid protein MtbC1/DNA-binding XRE family transcriptional regulator